MYCLANADEIQAAEEYANNNLHFLFSHNFFQDVSLKI